MINDKANEVIEERFQQLLSRYQIGLETSIEGSVCILVCDYLLHYVCHQIYLNHSGSYKDSPGRIKTKSNNQSH